MRNSSTPKHYLYYDKKTGEILSVTNEINPKYESKIEISFDDADKFLSGERHFRDYVVGYKRVAGDTVLSIIFKIDDQYSTKEDFYEWLLPSKKDTEVTVEWNKVQKSWNFVLKESAKKFYTDSNLLPKLSFYVTAENNFDFLIRTIDIEVEDLIKNKVVVVPFVNKLEEDINRISLGTKLVFKTYKLKVTYE